MFLKFYVNTWKKIHERKFYVNTWKKMIYKEPRQVNEEKSLYNKCGRTTGYPHTNKWNCALSLHCKQKLTQNGS